MGIKRLSELPGSLKWAVTAYLLLTSLGFGIAAMMSHERYDWNHEKTVAYYLGNEAEMQYPKLFSQLLQVSHVHSFTMPLLFVALWAIFSAVPVAEWQKKLFVAFGALSILIYNGAPYLVRYESARWVSLFTIGGCGLFASYGIPSVLSLYETWFGMKRSPHAPS